MATKPMANKHPKLIRFRMRAYLARTLEPFIAPCPYAPGPALSHTLGTFHDNRA